MVEGLAKVEGIEMDRGGYQYGGSKQVMAIKLQMAVGLKMETTMDIGIQMKDMEFLSKDKQIGSLRLLLLCRNLHELSIMS